MASHSNSKGKVLRIKAFKANEIDFLLELVEENLPIDQTQWDAIHLMYNGSIHSDWPKRDCNALRAKFSALLKSESSQTSNHVAPTHVYKAKLIFKKISTKMRLESGTTTSSFESVLAISESAAILLSNDDSPSQSNTGSDMDWKKQSISDLRTNFYESASNFMEEYKNSGLNISNRSFEYFNENSSNIFGHHGDKEQSLSVWFRENVVLKFLSSRMIYDDSHHFPDDHVIDFALSGGHNPSIAVSMPVFRPFISSTFTDTALERDLMILLLYPFLGEYARLSKVSFFQPSEMRWGIGKSLEVKHLTSATCIAELYRCQQSQGLSYLLIVGDKYGSRFPKAVIDVDVFITLRNAIIDTTDCDLIDEWYTLDNNHTVYTLRHLTDEALTNRYWGGDAAKIHDILAHAAMAIFPSDDPRRSLYTISITHEEAYYGIDSLDAIDRADSVAVVIRNLEGIENCDFSDSKSEIFRNLKNWIDVSYDINSNAYSPNISAQKALWALKHAVFTASSGEEQGFNVSAFSLPFICESSNTDDKNNIRVGIDLHNSFHRAYLQSFLLHVAKVMTHSIDRLAAAGGLPQYCEKDVTFREAIAHNAFATQKSDVFVHTTFTRTCVDDLLKFMNFDESPNFINNSSSSYDDGTDTDTCCPYFTVVGASGTGKTSLMANAFIAARSQWPHANTIIRFLGTTSNSTNIVPLLQVLINHIRRLYSNSGVEHTAIHRTTTQSLTSDYKELCDLFQEVLLLPTLSKPLIIMLDSLDQLSTLNQSRRLSFLPHRITNPYVRIVLSTLPDKEFEVWDRLVSLFPPSGPPAVTVPPWSSTDGETVLQSIMDKKKFNLTPSQHALVLNKFSQCPTCLFLVLSTFIARDWTSNISDTSYLLADNVSDCISQIFDNLVEDHGRSLVVSVIALITVSGGLSFDELLHILSLDDTVLEEVFEWWTPPVRRLPPLLLTRLLSVLDPFLVSRDENNAKGIFWYHRQLWTAARKYALPNLVTEKKYLRQIMEFFQGIWSGKAKPYSTKRAIKSEDMFNFLDAVNGVSKCNDSRDSSNLSADRLVPAHRWLDSEGNPNIRKLSTLPLIALRGSYWMEAKAALCSIETLECAAASGMVKELREMYSETIHVCEIRLGELIELLSDFDDDDGEYEELYIEETELGNNNNILEVESPTVELTVEEKEMYRQEKKVVQDLLNHVQEFDDYLKLSVLALEDPRLVLQRALNNPSDSLVRSIALQFLHALETETSRDNNCWSMNNRSLVLPINLPSKSFIKSRVMAAIDDPKNCAHGHTHFAASSGLVFFATVDLVSNRILVYEMKKAALAFDIRLNFVPDIVRWSPSGTRLACLGKDKCCLYIATISEGYDSVISSCTNQLSNDFIPTALIWAGDNCVVTCFQFPTDNEVVDLSRVITAAQWTSTKSNIVDFESLKLINNPGAEILSQITGINPGTHIKNMNFRIHSAIAPQGNLMVQLKMEGDENMILRILRLRGANRGKMFSFTLTEVGSCGGHSGVVSLGFLYTGEIVGSIRGDVVIVKLGDNAESCKITHKLKGVNSNNWTDFESLGVCPMQELIMSADQLGSLWVLKTCSENFVSDIMVLPCHSGCIEVIQCDESMRYMVTRAGREIFLWDLSAIHKKSLLTLSNESDSSSSSNQSSVYEPKIPTDDITYIKWHPNGEYFVASGGALALVHDSTTGEQFSNMFCYSMGTAMFLPEMENCMLLGTDYGGNHYLWERKSGTKEFTDSTYLSARLDRASMMYRLTALNPPSKVIDYITSGCDHIRFNMESKTTSFVGKANILEAVIDDLSKDQNNSYYTCNGIREVHYPVLGEEGHKMGLIYIIDTAGVALVDSHTMLNDIAQHANIIARLKRYKSSSQLTQVIAGLPTSFLTPKNALKHLKDCGVLLSYTSQASKADVAVVLTAVTENGNALEFAAPALLDDKKILSAAMKNSGKALQFTSVKWRSNKILVMSAVQQCGLALEFASDGLKDDFEVVKAAAESSGEDALEFASKRLQDDKEIKKVAKACSTENNSDSYINKKPKLFNELMSPILGLVWKIDGLKPEGVAFISSRRDVIAFVLKDEELTSAVLLLCRLSSGMELSRVNIPDAVLLGYIGGSSYYRGDKIDSVSSRIDVTADCTFLAARGRDNKIIFCELEWSQDSSTASARRLVHEYKSESPTTVVKFSPLTFDSTYAVEYLLAIGKSTGQVEFVKICKN